MSPRKGRGYASAWIREATRPTEGHETLSKAEAANIQFDAYIESPVERSVPDLVQWWGVSHLVRHQPTFAVH